MDKKTHTVILDFPIQTATGLVSTITLRRGKTRDVLQAQSQWRGEPEKAELALMASLSEEKLTMEDLQELDMADMAELQSVFQSLLRRTTRTPAPAASHGAAG